MRDLKRILCTAFLVLFFFTGTLRCSAKTADEILREQAKQYGVDDLTVPDAAQDFADRFGLSLSTDSVSDFLQPSALFSALWDAVVAVFRAESGTFFLLIALCLFSVLTRIFCDSFLNGSVLKTVQNLTVLLTATVLFSSFFRTATVLSDAVSVLGGFLGSFLPVFLGLCGASGYGTAAATAGSTLFLLANGLSYGMASWVVPAANGYFALGLGASLGGKSFLREMAGSCHKFLLWGIGLLTCLMTAITTLQTVVAVSGDSVSKRLSKFAAGNLIPIIGGAVGDSMDLVYACAAQLRVSVGMLGILVILFLLLTPFLSLLVQMAVLSFAVALSSGFEDGAFSSFLSVIRDSFGLLLSAGGGILLMLTVSVSVLMHVGGGL